MTDDQKYIKELESRLIHAMGYLHDPQTVCAWAAGTANWWADCGHVVPTMPVGDCPYCGKPIVVKG